MNNTIEKITAANLGMIWLVFQTWNEILNLYQCNTSGFGIRLFVIIAIVIMTLLICKFLILWIAGLVLNCIPDICIHADIALKWIVKSGVIKGCGWACRRVCRAGLTKQPSADTPRERHVCQRFPARSHISRLRVKWCVRAKTISATVPAIIAATTAGADVMSNIPMSVNVSSVFLPGHKLSVQLRFASGARHRVCYESQRLSLSMATASVPGM